ncbi:carboxypeptidase-like regulatory domain-containing protein [Clostridium oryzae]|uniref:Cna protein B-type domain protein n=1 Tax=Clostridium oryzae TaxID=1450648 RepID=A0A1V4I5N9_9CLOT|nr:carboxypeptidase-like regulatory domain-containing protein [Clostridium oryzae]OPJ55194.1 hypothetical protein CLORY_44550 [Clostridium oryzae]
MEKAEEQGKVELLDNAHTNVDNKLQEQNSMQQNRQDLDQQQEVDVKPSQVNVQRIDVILNNKLENYSGKITGTIYSNIKDVIDDEPQIYLYFGTINNFPVYRVSTDKNGKYVIEDLPPGFYSIEVICNNLVVASVYNIKVLPGQTTEQPLYLTTYVRKKK